MAAATNPRWFSTVMADPKSASLDSSCHSKASMRSFHRCTSSGLASMILRSAPAPLMTSKRRTCPVQFAEGENRIIPSSRSAEGLDQQADLWFSKQELRAIRAAGKATLAKVQQAGGDASLLDDDFDCVRGLEHGLCLRDDKNEDDADEINNVLDLKTRRQNIVHTILDQQREQLELGIDCAKGLSVTSVATTKWARDRAKNLGAEDYQQALAVWKDDEACAMWLEQQKQKQPERSSLALTARQAKINTVTATVATALSFLDDDDLEF